MDNKKIGIFVNRLQNLMKSYDFELEFCEFFTILTKIMTVIAKTMAILRLNN